MTKILTHEQQKGNLLKEFDGFANLAAINPEFCVDLFRGSFGKLNGGDFNAADVQAKAAVTAVNMMARGECGFGNAAKNVKAYFQPGADSEEEEMDDETEDWDA